MTPRYLLTAACALLLTNCVCVRPPDPMNPRVFITPGGKIVLDQTPIRVSPQPGSDKKVVVTWTLPADKEYTFPDNAVQIRPVPTKDQAARRQTG